MEKDNTGKSKRNYHFWEHWFLKADRGRQRWVFRLPETLENDIKKDEDWDTVEGQNYLKEMAKAFSFDKKVNPNSGDKVYRYHCSNSRDSEVPDQKGSPDELPLTKSARTAALKGFSFYEKLQTRDGNWPGDYGGPLFLLPGLIIVSYITKTPFEAPVRELMKQYMLNHQNEDGGWGLHIEDNSTMFGTAMQYVSLRLLGLEAKNEKLISARNWITENEGVTFIPPWGKFYLSLLGLYEWKGNDSLFPELWILPRWLPFHPGRYWCHARMVYLPMTYCYGHKLTAPETPLIASIREEIYPEGYQKINWKKSRSLCAKADEDQPLSGLYKLFISVANTYEKLHLRYFRQKALNFIFEYIEAEDRDTNNIDIGPINQLLNSLCVWHRFGKNSEQFKKHVDRWHDYLWLAEDGMKMNGYNGSQLWDTAFTGQALGECEFQSDFPEMAKRIYNYLDISQIKRNPDNNARYFRTLSKGGWPFSTEEHGWPITDCTSEGMKTMIQLTKSEPVKSIIDNLPKADRYNGAVDFLLSTQNKDGGWASYEESRAPLWVEKLNPSRIFRNIMTEISYVECSSASIQGLKKFSYEFPEYKKAEINKALRKGASFIKNKQLPDGSWYGSWAVCFTYGTWFGIEGLLAAGENKDSPEIKNACEFLVSKQSTDGSWGESYLSCINEKYEENEEGQVVNTAWALLGLMAARFSDKNVIEKGIRFLIDSQQPSGDWKQQSISGVFNGNCMITYSAYRNVFPLWALGRYVNNYQPEV